MAIANALAFLLYLSSSVILIRDFVKRDHNANKLALPIGILTTLALLFHAADIYFTMKFAQGWDLSLMSSLSIAAWLMAFIAMLAGMRSPVAHPGIVVYPLVALCLMFKVEAPGSQQTLSDPALEWHILLSLTAYALLALAAMQSVILAIQEKQLRKKNASGLMRKLPPLQTMEKALFQLLNAGFILLTLGLVTGFVFVNDFIAQHVAHKTVLSVIAWLVFAGLLWGRRQYGWRSQTAVKWTLSGFGFLLLAYVGSKLVLDFLIQS
ncbi:cytochrome C assembly family protein [Methylophaga pinxianii]|uniref:cytochrome C assembly family protein n=1 Tax=Methylophaga pinxianii TaxID=2881052 RepID=UPI001CF363C5|nr:cytochrome c biogenesis protein CcsA [Methylophaga pinxianii]MCB2428097.1 cytochrome c biogenesis protein CcsA [Methylophaga pinxianii]UPH45420.1 cytochrome c biogenesis protein CcsA [Methylophaga pinxianii]